MFILIQYIRWITSESDFNFLKASSDKIILEAFNCFVLIAYAIIYVIDRVTSVPQSGSLNIFGSNEKEYEQRAQLLKRLAYVIFCSEPDQYQKYMPEISGEYCAPYDPSLC